MKRHILPLITTLMLAVSLPNVASAYHFAYTTNDGYTLYFDTIVNSSGQVRVVRSGSPYYFSGDLVIPSTVTWNGNTYTVTGIGAQAFKDCVGLTSVTIPTTITSIGGAAFDNCTGITSVIFNAVRCGGSFSGCSNLTSITFGDSVRVISSGICTGCTSLTSVHLGNSVDSIGSSAFSGCTGLTSLTIPNSVTYINSSAFSSCTGLTSVTIPNSVSTINPHAFDRVKNIIYHGSATGSPWGALTVNGYVDNHLVYTDSTQTVLTACMGNPASVSIPVSVTSIGDYAFLDCNNLTSLTIPNAVTSIGMMAFGDCSSLASVIFNADSCTLISHTVNYLPFRGDSNLTSITFGDNVKQIPGRICRDCNSLTSVYIGNSVENIGGGAFTNCTGLTSITIPNSVTTIGDAAFSGCTGITSITIPDSVTTIGDETFSGCTDLTYLSSPNSVTSIGNYAFSGCTNITSIVHNNTFFVHMPTSFSGTYNIPEGIITICDNAFVDCAGLTSVNIPISVTSIGDYAFSGCTGLTSLSIPLSVTSIGDYTFSGCNSLTSITIPNLVSNIGVRAFEECQNLTSVVFNAQNCNYDCFYGSQKTSMFYNCYNFTSIVFGDSVQQIPYCLCYRLPGLTTVTIGKSVTLISNYAFSECTQISDVYMRGTTPPTVQNSPFTLGVIASANIHVPCNAVSAYQNADYWYQFSYNEFLPYFFTATAADPSLGSVQIFHSPDCDNPQAHVQAYANTGYHFVRWSDGNTDNPRYITVTQDTTIAAIFEEGNAGIDDMDISNINIYSANGCIYVLGTEDKQIRVYDMMGREVTNGKGEKIIAVPSVGIYMVRVDNLPAQKVVVMR